VYGDLFSALKRSKHERRPISTFAVFLVPWRIMPSDLFPFRINVQQWILQTVGRTLYAGDQPVARPLPTQGNMNAEEKQTDILASSGIRTHDPNVWAGEDVSCLRLRGRCSWNFCSYLTKMYFWRSFESVIVITVCILMYKVLYPMEYSMNYIGNHWPIILRFHFLGLNSWCMLKQHIHCKKMI
jgi:hypothetical protein